MTLKHVIFSKYLFNSPYLSLRIVEISALYTNCVEKGILVCFYGFRSDFDVKIIIKI